MKKEKNCMDLNHETAMRLWNKQFGKATEANDFTGRKVVKGAYNQRGSEYGWNVDHILPQSQGGKTADYNLICCHISTNDEKANKFPCFVSNNKKFEIVKVENHYEIQQVNKTSKEQILKTKTDANNVNFMDSAAGVRFFKNLKGIQNKPRFVGSILIRIKNIQNNAVIDFIERFFDKENISFEKNKNILYWGINDEIKILVKNYNMPLKEDADTLLDKCITLNTYLNSYFLRLGYINSYEIRYRIDQYVDKDSMYTKASNVTFNDDYNNNLKNKLYINDLVIYNTKAKDYKFEDNKSIFKEYNLVFKNLEKNLEKEESK